MKHNNICCICCPSVIQIYDPWSALVLQQQYIAEPVCTLLNVWAEVAYSLLGEAGIQGHAAAVVELVVDGRNGRCWHAKTVSESGILVERCT